MPSLKLETSAALSRAQEQALALEISTMAAELLNKPLSVIQVRIESRKTIAFGGEITENSAFLSIALIGEIAPEVKQILPEKFTALLEKYEIEPKRVFLNYRETPASAWGWI